MPEHLFVPENTAELESLGIISVGRHEVLAYKFDGTPVGEFTQGKYFREFKKALDWTVESPRHLHQFIIPLPGTHLAGTLSVDPETLNENLTLFFGEKVGIFPSVVKKEYAAIMNEDGTIFNLYISLDPKKTSVFSGDIVWFNLPKEGGIPTLNFLISPGFYESDELAVDVTYMLRRVNSVIGKLAKEVDTDYK